MVLALIPYGCHKKHSSGKNTMKFKLGMILITSFADLNFATSSPILANFATNLQSYDSANELGVWIYAVELAETAGHCEIDCTHPDTLVTSSGSVACEEGKQAACICDPAVEYMANCRCE
jgi:hypothetical protein